MDDFIAKSRIAIRELVAERTARAEMLSGVVLDDDRRRVGRMAAFAAHRIDHDFRRLAGEMLMMIAEMNGSDWAVEQLNERLRAAGRDDLVSTASERLSRPVNERLVDLLATTMVSGGARGRR